MTHATKPLCVIKVAMNIPNDVTSLIDLPNGSLFVLSGTNLEDNPRIFVKAGDRCVDIKNAEITCVFHPMTSLRHINVIVQ